MSKFDGKGRTGYHIRLGKAESASAHGGQVLVDAFCRRFGLWRKLAQAKGLDPRKRKGAGFAPEAICAQLLFTLSSGGVGLADAERTGKDPVLMGLVGLEKGADESTLGEWLRAQTAESVEALWEINGALIDEVWAVAKPGRVCHGGEEEWFFDDTEIEVYGKSFEGARLNYNGDLALSLQALWRGPFVVDAILDGAGDVSEHLPVFLGQHEGRWEQRRTHFYADSGSSAAKFLDAIREAGFTHWSVSYNKWTDVLERLARELPERRWSAPNERGEQFTWLRHMPGEAKEAVTFASVRRKPEGEMFWRYAFVACEPGEGWSPQAVFQRHALKGDKERGFSELLSDLDLHHPPCERLVANQAFYALAILTYNVLTALKVLELEDAHQPWRIRTLIHNLLTVPVTVSMHARYTRALIRVPPWLLRVWRLFVQQWIPKRQPGRPSKREDAIALRL
jgi:Transposase DDE domain group 1